MTEKEFNLLKEEINEGLRNKNIRPAVHIICAFNRFDLISNISMENLFNCLRNRIYVTCSMYDSLKEME
jgi:hypothetical protein